MSSNSLKTILKRLMYSLGFDLRRVKPWNVSSYSNLGEDRIIARYINALQIANRYCVDIAASDGLTMSNTFELYRTGWHGLAVESDAEQFAKLAFANRKFDNVILCRWKITPENVVRLLEACETPIDFGFLSLDLDGYDHALPGRILQTFRPSLLFVEINEKKPLPLKFTVKWDPAFVYAGDHFYGQSICQLHSLCMHHGYAIIELHYNNAFLVAQELFPQSSLSAEEAYRIGYLEPPDRKVKFPHNADVQPISHLPPFEAVDAVNELFPDYAGKYTLDL